MALATRLTGLKLNTVSGAIPLSGCSYQPPLAWIKLVLHYTSTESKPHCAENKQKQLIRVACVPSKAFSGLFL